jgi:hypothetical protein
MLPAWAYSYTSSENLRGGFAIAVPISIISSTRLDKITPKNRKPGGSRSFVMFSAIMGVEASKKSASKHLGEFLPEMVLPKSKANNANE